MRSNINDIKGVSTESYPKVIITDQAKPLTQNHHKHASYWFTKYILHDTGQPADKNRYSITYGT
jgi:hypothetical protein